MNSSAAMLMREGEGHVAGLKDLIAELPAGLQMAEIGVYAGESTRLFLSSGKVELAIAVDMWADFRQDGRLWRSPYAWTDVRACFSEVQNDYWPKVLSVPVPSLQAAEAVPDGALDLVYIDANHSYAAVRADILAWAPKVKRDGFLAGHDYEPAKYPGVVRAVDRLLGTVRVRHFADTSWLVRL